jgi:hypothetical protein
MHVARVGQFWLEPPERNLPPSRDLSPYWIPSVIWLENEKEEEKDL